jgi:hypothetical protein
MILCPALPINHVKFTQFACQVDERNGYYFRFPLKTQRCTEGIIHKIPGHLNDFLQFCLVPFQALCVLYQEIVGMIDLKLIDGIFFSLSTNLISGRINKPEDQILSFAAVSSRAS